MKKYYVSPDIHVMFLVSESSNLCTDPSYIAPGSGDNTAPFGDL